MCIRDSLYSSFSFSAFDNVHNKMLGSKREKEAEVPVRTNLLCFSRQEVVMAWTWM